MIRRSPYAVVLFDLDGTLVDTAPDMVAVLAALQRDEGRPEIDYGLARSWVSHGAAGLIRLAFPDAPPVEFERLRLLYLDRYAAAVCRESTLFPDLPPLLDELDGGGVPWGIVTNKPERMTIPLLRALGLDRRSAATVCGDSLPQRKPDPEPLLFASRKVAVDPASAVYVGDAERDIIAGHRAGMATIAAAYGYIPDGEDPGSWDADHVVENPSDLANLLLNRVNLARQ